MLEWTCSRTADHAIDTVLAPAFFLASRKRDDYPAYGVFTPGPAAEPDVLAEALEAAARVLVGVVSTTDPAVRAVIWRRPTIATAPPEDFVPRGGLELILHADDVCCGLGVPFRPPEDLCDRLRVHTQTWPAWSSPGWAPMTMRGDAWADLQTASGRHRPSTS